MKIQIINFRSKPKKTFFAPEWNYFIFEYFLKNINFKHLSSLILKKRKSILKLPVSSKIEFVDGYTGLGKNSTTARYSEYNVLKWEDNEIEKIKNQIIEFHNRILILTEQPLVNELYAQCWVNILNKGQKINPHLHSVQPNTYLGGHICVKCTNTSTKYINPIQQINEPEVYSSKNEVGKITLFQNNIPHYTDTHNSDDERITIAFDLVLEKLNENFIKLI